MIKLLSVLLFASVLSFAEDAPKPADPKPAPAQTQPAKPATSGVLKQQLKSYEEQQKQALRVAKAQTKLALEQAKAQQLNDKINHDIAVATAKGN